MGDQTLNMEMIFKLIDQATPGLKQLKDGMDQLKASLDKNTTSQDNNAASLDRLNTRRATGTRAVRDATNAVDDHNQALFTSASRYETLVLAHEALQGRWTRFGPSLMVLAERMDLIGRYGMAAGATIGALAAAIAGLVIHEIHVEQMARAFGQIQAALVGTGKSAELATSQISGLVTRLSEMTGITKQDAVEIVAAMSRIPELAGPQIQKLSMLVSAFAEVTGKTATAAAKELGDAFVHPEKGAKELDKQLGFLSVSQLESINRFMRLGEIAKAQDIIYQNLEARLKSVKETHTPLQKAIEDLTKAWNKLTGDIGGTETEERWLNGSKFVRGLADSISYFNKKIEEGSYFAKLFANMLSAIPFDPFNMDAKTNPQLPANGPWKGKITGPGGAPTAADNKKAQADAKSADQARFDQILKNGEALESQATKQRHLNEEIAGYNKIVNSPNATAEQKATARDRIQAIEEQKAKMKNLRDEIEASIARDIGIRKQLTGETDKQTMAERLLLEIQEGKYKGKYPQGQIDELAAKLRIEIADQKRLTLMQEEQSSLNKLNTLEDAAILKRDKTINQLDAIDQRIKMALNGQLVTPKVTARADEVRQAMIAAQVSQNQEALSKTEQELSRTTDEQIKKINSQNEAYLKTATQLRDLSEQEQVRMKYEQKIRELKPTDIGYEKEHADLIAKEAEDIAKLAAAQAQRIQFESDWRNGAIKAMNEFKESSVNVAALAHTAFKSAFTDISSTIQTFMETGKLSFQSLGDSFKKTIDKMISDALAARLMNALFGDFNKTGTLGGMGGSATSFLSSIFGGGREGGGPVRAGQAYIVGEKRPELFIPNTSGTIIPNVAGIGTTNPNVHINISALDGADVMKVLHSRRRDIAMMVSGASSAYNLRS